MSGPDLTTGEGSVTATAPSADAALMRAQVLDAAACRTLRDTVELLREQWVSRDAQAFHTLGAALYLDRPRPETLAQFAREAPPPTQYDALRAATDMLLRSHFGELYTALARALERLLQAEVRYAEGLALPGFHIYEHAAIYGDSRYHVPHFDRQYECAQWPPEQAIDFTRAISITLPLALPVGGGGLRVWDLTLAEVQALAPAAARARAAAASSERHVYRLGELVCHPGHRLHQVAPWVSRPGDQRITLQAHGLFYDGAWQLYW